MTFRKAKRILKKISHDGSFIIGYEEPVNLLPGLGEMSLFHVGVGKGGWLFYGRTLKMAVDCLIDGYIKDRRKPNENTGDNTRS